MKVKKIKQTGEETKKTFQDLKIEIQSIKNIQTKVILEMKNVVIKKGTIEVSFVNKVQDIKQRMPDRKETIEEMDI